jgi:3-keto-5-aminohexanoate cleavage enzyme
VSDLPAGCVWSATRIGRFQLRISVAALFEGGGEWVGLEDNIYNDQSRRELDTIRRLVECIVRIAGEPERRVATPDGTRVMSRTASSRIIAGQPRTTSECRLRGRSGT